MIGGFVAVNDAVRVETAGQLTTADLAARADFKLGASTVSPSNRTIAGPDGTADVEPRVMQVLVVLAEAPGQVVARETLFQRCWGGVYVGDDSLNRVIRAIRKLAAEVGGESFAVETVRQTGYRLSVSGGASIPGSDRSDEAATAPSRRLFLGAGAAALAAAGGAAWWWRSPRADPRFDASMDRGLTALRYGDRRTDSDAVQHFRQAVAIRPDDAGARGLLAYALVAESQSGPRSDAGNAIQEAQRAAQAALRLDSNQPDALTALVLIERSFQSRAAVEDGLRRILGAAPDNPRAMSWLDRLLQGAGRTRESWQLNERLIALEPISPTYMLRRALKLWVFGRSEEAQQASQSAMDLWPAHPLVRMSRLLICAFTDRTREALALVDEEAKKPILLSPAGVSMWRASLAALETRTPAAIEAARTASLDGARSSPALASYGLLAMSALGDLDTAFDIADGFLLSRGPIVLRRGSPDKQLWVDGPQWRNTLGLFTPASRAMRSDPRFRTLSDGLGLTDYWRARGAPDAFLFKP
jgi:DNA-binding winged helix-turn-helix (wHTH) protein/tetratricopeptide (TPR) repeat protein